MLNTFVDPALPYGLTHMWSLAVEVTFYLALPLIMLVAVGRTLRPWRVLAVLAALSAISVWWHLDGADRIGQHSAGSPHQWLPAYLIWFALGIGLALVTLLLDQARREGRTPGRVVSRIAAAGAQSGVCWVAAFGVFLVSATPLAGPTLLAPLTPAESLTKNVLYAVIGVLLVASGVFATEGRRYTRSFGHLWLRRMGWISYSLFCLHMSVLQFVWWATDWPIFGGHALQVWLITLAISLVLSDLAYRLVERPALRLKSASFGGRGRRSGSTASAEASDTSSR